MRGVSVCLVTALAALQVAAEDGGGAAAERMRRTGGVVREAGAGRSVLVLDLQGQVPAGVLREAAQEIEAALRLPIAFAARKPAPFDKVREGVLADASVALVVAVVSEPGKPALLVAPEDRWAAVNVTPLNPKGTGGEALALRVRKELWRAVGYLMGAGDSDTEHCLLKPVFGLDGLDALQVQTLSPEPLGRIFRHASALGIRPIRIATYRTACTQGWAPAPTNDAQRAIWDEVKAKRGQEAGGKE